MPTILVVDDSPVSRRLLGFTLQRHGYEVHDVGDGPAALAFLEQTAVALVIADLAMPGMDGLALLGAIRSHERLRGLPLIMLTASTEEQHRLRAATAGAQAYLTKPAGSRDLLAAVAAALADGTDPQHT